jgi:mono/diheme cytochrome c family protein
MKVAKTGVLATSGVFLACAWAFAQQQQTPRNTTVDGSTLYKQHCAVCHGTSGKGDGPMAKMLVAKTPDLTRIAERHGGKFPRVEVNQIISGESILAGGHGTREMPVWGPEFSEVERDVDRGNVRVDNLARYLETLQGK